MSVCYLRNDSEIDAEQCRISLLNVSPIALSTWDGAGRAAYVTGFVQSIEFAADRAIGMRWRVEIDVLTVASLSSILPGVLKSVSSQCHVIGLLENDLSPSYRRVARASCRHSSPRAYPQGLALARGRRRHRHARSSGRRSAVVNGEPRSLMKDEGQGRAFRAAAGGRLGGLSPWIGWALGVLFLTRRTCRTTPVESTRSSAGREPPQYDPPSERCQT
jgi:hypothetical protein